ncbi:MAG: phosphoribosylamine--glycine ligase [Acidobacteriota bacterium]
MKVLLVGSGGREHTLAWKLSQSPRLSKLFCAPGNAGTLALGENVPIKVEDLEGLASFARSSEVDLTIVGPEAPLAAGIVDRFRTEGLRIAGPTQAAAQLESSKVFAKTFLAEQGIPTAAFEVHETAASAEEAIRSGAFEYPVVLKADGLAAGKGVLICQDQAEALQATATLMREKRFGAAGERVVIEEFLAGEETSFMVFTDGRNILPMVPSQDHKAAYEGDRGPNTGGMGAYSVDFLLDSRLREVIVREIIEPAVLGMEDLGIPFQGILYAGLMLTEAGPKVLEFNVRFGDPETQAVVPRLEGDLLEIFSAVADGDLSGCQLEWSNRAAVCVVVASQGYPGSYQSGFEITGIPMAEEDPDTVVFHAGTSLRDDKIVTAGGRVLGVTSLRPSLEAAIISVYEAVNKIHFDGMYYRRDIAAKGLRKLGIA